MSDYLAFAGASADAQRAALEDILRQSPRVMQVLEAARAGLPPDWRLVSGAIYNQVWNHLTGRPQMHGVKDMDLFYMDADLSYEAEDRYIKAMAAACPGDPPVEVRNQARVHLWYEKHFGHPCPALISVEAGIDRFACLTHMVGVRLTTDDRFDIYAPAGLDDIFAFRLVPNAAHPNRATHEAKAARQKALWPELDVVPWPEDET